MAISIQKGVRKMNKLQLFSWNPIPWKKWPRRWNTPLASSVVPLQLNLNSKAVTMDCLRRIVFKGISGGPLWSEGGKLMLLIIVIIRNKRSNIAGCSSPMTTALATCWCTTSCSTRCRCRCRWSRWTGSYNTNDTITMILFASHPLPPGHLQGLSP